MDYISILKKYAVNYLSKYDTSKKNLERILLNKVRRIKTDKKQKNNLYKSIAPIINNLESKKIIDDDNYTHSKISNLYLLGKSKIFIKSYLLKKGIEKSLIDEKISDFDLKNPNWEDESIKIFIKKKRINVNKYDEKNLAKMARAGFSYEVIKKNLKNIN